jgi:hypothetical protein
MRWKLRAWTEIAFQNLLLQPEVHYLLVLPRCDWFGTHDTSHLQTTPGSLLPQDHCTGTKLKVVRLLKIVVLGFVHCLNLLKPLHFGSWIYFHHQFNSMWEKIYYVGLFNIYTKKNMLWEVATVTALCYCTYWKKCKINVIFLHVLC